MKIFILSPTESPKTVRGKRHPNLRTFLINKGYEVLYISSSFSHSNNEYIDSLAGQSDYYDEEDKIMYLDCGSYSKNISISRIIFNFRYIIKANSFVSKKVSPSDIIIFPSRPTELFLLVRWISLFQRIGVICDVRDVWPDAFKEMKSVVYIPFSMYCKSLLRTARGMRINFLYVSPSYYNWVEHYFPGSKSIFAPLGFDKPSEEVDGKLSSINKRLNFLHVGKLTYQLDLKNFIKALSKFDQDWHLTLVGDPGNGDRYDEVLNLIIKSGLESKVDIIGEVKRSELDQYYRNADICVISMISDALPNKLFDTLKYCKPVIGIGNLDLRVFIKKHNIGWVCDDVEDDILNILHNIITDDLAKIHKNIKKIRSEYQADIIFEEIEKIVRVHTVNS